jgi:predicted nucleotidyltransferase
MEPVCIVIARLIMGKNDILAILRDFKERNAERFGILALGVFGSVARDQIRDDSDIDICIKTLTPNPFNLVHIKQEIERRTMRKIDLVRIREAMNPSLKKRIETEGVYV